MDTLIEGAVLAVIVVFLFLRDWRATLIAAVALPLSVIPTFWAMDADGLLAQPRQPARHHARHRHPGRRRHRRDREHRAPHAHGQDRPIAPRSRRPTRSGWRSSRSRSTIIAVFVPVSFMGGIAGQFFKQFGLTVAVAVFFSLLVARLITPMIAAYFLRAHGHAEPKRRAR